VLSDKLRKSITMPPKAKKNDAQEAPAVTTVADGPLAALTPREQTIMLQCLLTVPGFPAVSSHFIPSFPAVLLAPLPFSYFSYRC
jgi:hypothetical protein